MERLPISIALGLILVGLALSYYRRLPLPPTIPRFREKNIYPWEYYRDWSQKFGPLISLPSYGATVVVINTAEAAVELLDRRKAFACRPRWPMVELLGRQDNIGFTYYGERLQKMRKLLRSNAFTSVPEKWGGLMDNYSASLCVALLDSRRPIYETVERVSQQLITRLAYGQEADEDYIHLASKIKADTTVALQPGRWMINLFPILRYIPSWVPGAGFQKWAKDARGDLSRMIRTPFNEVKEKQARGVATYSFVRECLEKLPTEHSSKDEDIIVSAAGSLFSAGTETLTGTILVFISLMLRNQNVQERAYQEIIGVIGKQRLPRLEDQKSLPYVNAVIQEVQRFHPAVPLVAHGNTQEDYYNGQRIPKKSWVIANVWAILHDEKVYSNPDIFNPERFYHPHNDGLPDPANVVFGFGRRRCPGAEFANSFLYLVISRILAMHIIFPEDPLQPPPLEFELGLVSSPKKFTCKFEPRSNADEILKNHRLVKG